jgi:diguanylate cyclase (GGDEF)-like protein
MFKFGRKHAEHSPSTFAHFTTEIASTPAAVRAHGYRRDLLHQISNFLLDHQLEVNPGNLALAQAVFSGSNVELSRKIMARQLANEPITQAWLDGLTSDAATSATAGGRPTLQLAGHHPAPVRGLAPNHREAVEAMLKREYRAASATTEPLTIAFCDIDRVKLINDTHGDDTGDRVIHAIARVLQRVSGENCHLARDGGAAFVLVFHGLTPEETVRELDQARRNFAQRRLIDRKTRKTIGSVTFSGGVADLFGYADPHGALIAAEAALQEAKEQGRNRIVVARNSA